MWTVVLRGYHCIWALNFVILFFIGVILTFWLEICNPYTHGFSVELYNIPEWTTIFATSGFRYSIIIRNFLFRVVALCFINAKIISDSEYAYSVIKLRRMGGISPVWEFANDEIIFEIQLLTTILFFIFMQCFLYASSCHLIPNLFLYVFSWEICIYIFFKFTLN